MKKCFMFISALLVASGVWAQEFYVNGINYRYIGNDQVAFYEGGYNCKGDYTVPTTITYGDKTYKVTAIDDGAFRGSSVNTVTIPNSVTSIGKGLFAYCESLTSVKLPNNITSIGEEFFRGCKNLRTFTIPEGVTFIETSVFEGCTSLTSITIPDNITLIRDRAFWGCTGLTSIVIPNSVTIIADLAFSGCSGLTSITISNSVSSIGERSFNGCTGLTSITFSESLDVSGSGLCLTKDGIKYNVLNAKQLEVAGTKSSSDDIVIPSTISAGNTFSVTSIGPEVFRNNKSLRSISIPNSVTTIGTSAFSWCTGLTSITIPNNVTFIGDYAFSGCTGLTSITIPNSLTSTGYGVFSGCAGLTSIAIPNSVTTIDGYAFNGCVGLTSIAIPNSVTTIGGYAFNGCTGLTSITLPSSVTKVEEYAFSGCTALKNVTCLATVPPTAYANSFENYNGYLYIPCESKDDYDFASCWGSFKHVECLGAETVELTKDEVAVVPEKTEAVFSMPKNENANTYTLTIQNNGVTFCTLTFNAQGQLANIDFSTTKSYELKSDVAGFKFTVTGLSTASDYGYSFKALDNAKAVLKEYSGSFTTKNEDGTGGSAQGGSAQGGQGGEGGEQGGEQGGEGGSTAVSEVSNATAVTIVNGQVLVNGEAPAFVVTVSGQKIANANLKAGVYFVVVDGETVGVSVR